MQPWQLDDQVLQADDCDRSVSFRAAFGFPYLLSQTSIVISWSASHQLQPWFPVVCSPLGHEVCALAVSSSGNLSSREEA